MSVFPWQVAATSLLAATACSPRVAEVPKALQEPDERSVEGGGPQASGPCVALVAGDARDAFGKILMSRDGRSLYIEGLPILPNFDAPALANVETLVLHDVLLADLDWLTRFSSLRALVMDHVRGGERFAKRFMSEEDGYLTDVLVFEPERARGCRPDTEYRPVLCRDWMRWRSRPDRTLMAVGEVLSALPELPALERLWLRSGDFVSIPIGGPRFGYYFHDYQYPPPPALSGLGRHPRLREVHLDMAGGWLSLDKEPEQRIERLEVRNAYLMSLAPLASYEELRQLELMSITGVGDQLSLAGELPVQPPFSLHVLAGMKSLEEVRLVNSHIADLRFLEGTGALRKLDLRWTRVGDLSALESPARPCEVDLTGMPPHPYRVPDRCADACCLAGEVEHRLTKGEASCKASCGGACDVKHHCTWDRPPPDLVLPWKVLWSDELSAGMTGLNLVEVSCE